MTRPGDLAVPRGIWLLLLAQFLTTLPVSATGIFLPEMAAHLGRDGGLVGGLRSAMLAMLAAGLTAGAHGVAIATTVSLVVRRYPTLRDAVLRLNAAGANMGLFAGAPVGGVAVAWRLRWPRGGTGRGGVCHACRDHLGLQPGGGRGHGEHLPRSGVTERFPDEIDVSNDLVRRVARVERGRLYVSAADGAAIYVPVGEVRPLRPAVIRW